MTTRQTEIAAESFAACLLARTGYDVLVQYGPNQPQYDLIAIKGNRTLFISVKGSQDGGWPLAVSDVKGRSYHEAIDEWRANQKKEGLIFVFVQFKGVPLLGCPRVYVATPDEIAAQMKGQCNGRGHGRLSEDNKRYHPKSRYEDRLPFAWEFSQERIDTV